MFTLLKNLLYRRKLNDIAILFSANERLDKFCKIDRHLTFVAKDHSMSALRKYELLDCFKRRYSNGNVKLSWLEGIAIEPIIKKNKTTFKAREI